MTSRGVGMELRLLGPLEAVADGEKIVLGGAKQRTVFATLLLRAGEVVPVERLIDEIWGDDPPQSAAHSLESYVSRLRQVLNGHGPVLVRRGSGYGLELGDATLDADAFEELASMAGEAADAGDHRRTSELVREALSHWRGPVLGDVVLGPTGRAGAERLEELRLHALEMRFDAELALGRDKELVGELQALVGQNPYREQFVGQLMLALYRSGRQAEALGVYEETRRRLDSDLGLQPSAELRTLSGQIVRQESHLRTPTRVIREPLGARRRTGRVATLVAGGLAAAAVMSLVASGGTTPAEPAGVGDGLTANRVALVVPRSPRGANATDPSVYHSARSFRDITAAWGHEARIFVINGSMDVERRAQDVVDGDFDLVVVAGDGPGARALARLVPGSEPTRFAFVGARLADLGVADARNAAGYPFADQEAAQLAGYLSALVPPRRAPGGHRADMVSIVTGPRTPSLERMAAGYVKGAKRASPSVRVRVDFVRDPGDRTACEAVANRQIDAGSDVVFAVGSACSSGALAVVRVRGVWGIRAEDERTQKGPHILGTVSMYWESAVARPINEVEVGTFPAGKDVELGLADDYSVLFLAEEEARVSEALWSKVVSLCSQIRERTAPPLANYH